ncbi:ornithine decarboxylase [Ricinus communis]|uniref:ornithine decarboxylase n=1 Tax=Ricinus communis TaxID=3988 RepID=B9R8G7_RICCO|nr:ornithine decarboxylase [Ricinus communis]EEF52797.1 ornithine decarboxylase, putative [Ricinus communis]|eukprot:XP_002510610.1 ornithine decarboxylase [Ricinus communis]
METRNSMQVIIAAPGVEGKTVKSLPKTEHSLTEFVQSVILNTQVTKEPFYVLNLGAVAELMDTWSRQLPMIQPFYAVKCNSEPSLLGALAALGCNFDCASKVEIQTILSLGVSPDRIVYANPCKAESHLKYAASVGVNLTTFDSVYELDKISKLHPRCALLLRLKSPDDSAAKWASLGSKFGALPQEVEPLLRAAQAANLTVSGVSFHIGSESTNPNAYRTAIASAKAAFDTAGRLGMPPMTLLNVGGGFTAGSFFDEAATVINSALQDYFAEYPQLKVISEPGRYFAETVFTLAASIIGKRVRDDVREYWLNDGVFGSFLCVAYGITPPACLPLALSSNRTNPTCEGAPTHMSTLFGPTCDSVDKIVEEHQLPELETNDWLVFPNMGAYSKVCATNFNGFSPDVVFTYLVYGNLH